MNPRRSIVIVGAGHAGGTAAALLRQYGWDEDITLIGEEPTAPYQRPPLSKAYLKGAVDAESLKLRPDDFYAEQGIALRTGVRVERIERETRSVRLSDGEPLAYDRLILATGSSLRRLEIPGAGLAGVHMLRGIEDADALKARLGPGRRIVIVGAGYVGLEVAASARALGAEVVVIEREARVLARVASPQLSALYEARHRGEGVTLLTRTGVSAILGGSDGQVSAVELGDGKRIDCDLVLVGVGANACQALAVDAGLECAQGVVVDEAAVTSDPTIYAIGDMTWRPMPLYGGRRFRLESVPNALEQAKQAVSAILGRPAPAPETPWFWSDQYDLKLQIAGVPFDADRIVTRGDGGGRLAVFHLKGDRLLAAEAVNAPGEFMAARQLIARGTPIDALKLGDPERSMKDIAA
jgi:3-phenylpropionate/trans-cinnamate dioxygenase ferredoxin reductase subunit